MRRIQGTVDHKTQRRGGKANADLSRDCGKVTEYTERKLCHCMNAVISAFMQ